MALDLATALKRFTEAKTKRIKKDWNASVNKKLDVVGKKAEEKLHEYLMEWYDTYYPKNYKRTHGVGLSPSHTVVGKSDNNKTVKVFFDMRTLAGRTENGGKGWQAHRSFSTRDENGEYIPSADFKSGIIEFIETGEGGGSPKNPRKGHGGVHMIKKTREWLREYLNEEVRAMISTVVQGGTYHGK